MEHENRRRGAAASPRPNSLGPSCSNSVRPPAVFSASNTEGAPARSLPGHAHGRSPVGSLRHYPPSTSKGTKGPEQPPGACDWRSNGTPGALGQARTLGPCPAPAARQHPDVAPATTTENPPAAAGSITIRQLQLQSSAGAAAAAAGAEAATVSAIAAAKNRLLLLQVLQEIRVDIENLKTHFQRRVERNATSCFCLASTHRVAGNSQRYGGGEKG
jgi:hypothetical protein